ncbi:hypothetical protein [Acidithiobacillus sp.]|jgi:hypothetical protein|uniref:hypothetical protein n=1 Tax=Acidithiobacillus sp. TaxID=1872118 RepID=UPI0025C6B909|nr:hypothetical protein [Acidithiobacillus sp.]MCK9189779.1 hypothetical protein [Acidithiobacillus sp.]MCK9358236.1 hypothetical protein [Acidithiobacillus sp.]
MKKTTFVLAAILAALPISASAGLFGSVANAVTGGGSAQSSGDPVAASNQLVGQYVAGNISVLTAQKDMAQALHLKGQVATIKATLTSLKTGAAGKVGKSGLEHAGTIIGGSSKAIAEAQAKKPILSAEDKIDYAKGLGSLGGGILHYVGMKNAASSFSSSVSSLSPMTAAQDASALSSGLYVVKSLPSSISNLGSSLNEAVSFAKSNKIAVPASATNALGSL